MIARIEPAGISVRRGKVQIRFSFYLELGDARYEEHYVQVSIFPPEGYPGEVGNAGNPTDMDAYNEWVESLPKVWQNNPFHNHFVRVGPDVRDGEIHQLMGDSLAEFYSMWSRGEDIVRTWKRKGRETPGDMSVANVRRCELKGLDIAKRAKAFEHKGRS